LVVLIVLGYGSMQGLGRGNPQTVGTTCLGKTPDDAADAAER
jgi:hypothetical protein